MIPIQIHEKKKLFKIRYLKRKKVLFVAKCIGIKVSHSVSIGRKNN